MAHHSQSNRRAGECHGTGTAPIRDLHEHVACCVGRSIRIACHAVDAPRWHAANADRERAGVEEPSRGSGATAGVGFYLRVPDVATGRRRSMSRGQSVAALIDRHHLHRLASDLHRLKSTSHRPRSTSHRPRSTSHRCRADYQPMTISFETVLKQTGVR